MQESLIAPATPRTPPPVALTIAGSDNSAGAGIQADLKTFVAHDVYGLTAVTCVVAEVPGRVTAVHPVPPEIVHEQITLCFKNFPVAGVKTGMLYSRQVMEAVLDAWRSHPWAGQPPSLVVDPVMVATSGDLLLQPDALAVYKERLFPLATLVTPNLDEVRALLGREVRSVRQMRDAARELAATYGSAWLVKGGHLDGNKAVDVLWADGELTEYATDFIRGVKTHGTGCTYSAAITANLAKGLPLADAVDKAKGYVITVISAFLRWTDTSGRHIDTLSHNVYSKATVRKMTQDLEECPDL